VQNRACRGDVVGSQEGLARAVRKHLVLHRDIIERRGIRAKRADRRFRKREIGGHSETEIRFGRSYAQEGVKRVDRDRKQQHRGEKREISDTKDGRREECEI